jgi:Na+-driven multidrug efflux pump
MIFASLLNIALSIAFIFPFGLAGVAAASLISNAFASLFCLRALIKNGALLPKLNEQDRGRAESKPEDSESSCNLAESDNKLAASPFPGWDSGSARKLLRIGLPLGMRNLVISLGDLLVQIYINRFGAEFIAAIAMAKRMYVVLLLTGTAVEGSVATFVAQNFGAGRMDRVKMGVRSGLKLILGGSAITMVIVFLFGRLVMSLMLDGDPAQVEQVLDTATLQLMVLTAGLPMVNILFLYRATLQGLGKPLIPTLTGFVEMAGLMGAVVFLTPIVGEWGVLLSDPIGWIAPATLSLVSYYVIMRRKL